MTSLRENREQQVTAGRRPGEALEQLEMSGSPEQPCARRAIPRLPARLNDQVANATQPLSPTVHLSAAASQSQDTPAQLHGHQLCSVTYVAVTPRGSGRVWQ